MIIDYQPDVARGARRWSARSAGPDLSGVALAKARGGDEVRVHVDGKSERFVRNTVKDEWTGCPLGKFTNTEAGALWALKEQQPGDVPQTWAEVLKAKELLGYKPKTTFKEGVEKFFEWRNQRVVL